MRYLPFTLLAVVATALAAPEPAPKPSDPGATVKQDPFPDFGFLPPPDQYTGKVFQLSQDYPSKLPPSSQVPDFLEVDFKKDWKEYLLKARAYCFEGNIEVDWRVQNNKVRRWYHAPWQHFGPNAREGIHGMTREAPIKPKVLAATQTSTGQAYAVAFYNELAGFTIGKVWKDHTKPNVEGISFPHGAIICKLLFVDVPPEQIPCLVNPLLWQGYISDTFTSNNRSIRTLALLQMDLMVRDHLAPVEWVFGTYQYNGALKKENFWENLVPVGVQWGEDPDIADDHSNPQPVKTIINPNLKESVINDGPELPPTHLGWNGRLNGPLDQPRSSCMSCHATAEYPMYTPMTPFFQDKPPRAGSPEWMRWFQNTMCATPFDKGCKSTDFSLQMAQGLQAFDRWKKEQGGMFAAPYVDRSRDIGEESPFKLPPAKPGERPVYNIQRGF